jgi:hypothetical protein
MEQPSIVVTGATSKAGRSVVEVAQAQPPGREPKTTGVLVLLTAKPGVTWSRS